MSFGSRRGLSTYERHAHPAFRNIERRRADHREHEKGKNWTVEEVTLLKGLWGLYKGRKHTNKEINKFLTNETIDQIKYQKKKLNLFGEGSSQEVTSLATEGGGAVSLIQAMRMLKKCLEYRKTSIMRNLSENGGSHSKMKLTSQPRYPLF